MSGKVTVIVQMGRRFVKIMLVTIIMKIAITKEG